VVTLNVANSSRLHGAGGEHRHPLLQTVMERVLDEISFDATDKGGETIQIDAAYVQARVGDLAKNADLSKFIL
jgi:ATP-dependent protease HslVU (ClpYQ) ATPase subunit